MNEQTSLSLLARVSDSADSHAWDELVELYSPLLQTWLGRHDVQPADVDDLVQDILLVMSRELPKFEHKGHDGAFRGWLKTILVHRLKNFWRGRGRRPRPTGGSGFLDQIHRLEDGNSELSQLWDRHHDQHVLRHLMRIVQPRFSPNTWQAFRRVALGDESPGLVAAELGISVNAVFIAKSRVLHRLRQEAAGLVDGSGFFFDNV